HPDREAGIAGRRDLEFKGPDQGSGVVHGSPKLLAPCRILHGNHGIIRRARSSLAPPWFPARNSQRTPTFTIRSRWACNLMAIYSTNEFKSGLKVMLDGDPCSILENEFVKPGKGQAFN